MLFCCWEPQCGVPSHNVSAVESGAMTHSINVNQKYEKELTLEVHSIIEREVEGVKKFRFPTISALLAM